MVQRYEVLLMRDSRATFYPQLALYADRRGEVVKSRGQNRPMYLHKTRYHQLEAMYFSHSLARDVVRKRSSESKILRQFYM